MKSVVAFTLATLASGAVLNLDGTVTTTSKDNTITKVVKLLQNMLDKSKAEGDKERKIYAKFKCYCDTSEAEKTASIKKETEAISLLESQIEEVQGDTGGLSEEVADLKAKIAENRQARSDAQTLRKKENKAFRAERADLSQALKQMRAALEVLSKVGADQTASTGADNKQFMAGKAALLSLESEVKHALNVASALMTSSQKQASASFLQAPFTGTYTSQSAQVLGIIKNMRDTFKANLADAITTEDNAQKAFDEFMEIKIEEFKTMKASYNEKQKALGGNDGDLATKRKQLAQSQKQKASDEEFLGKLLPLCEEKAQGYANRKLLRANEEAAIAEAISILNSDDAFATFGGVSATTTGSTRGGALRFIQLRSARRHMSGDVNKRHMLKNLLQTAAKEASSARLTKVLAAVNAENPFSTVLDEIDRMIDLIAEEGKQDKENLDWCKSERKENNANLKQRKKDILALENKIDKLTKAIENPKTGLKAEIASTEQSLVDNTDAQTKQTAERTESNLAYQADVKNLVDAEGILTKAIKVLNAYYDDLEKKLAAGEALLQKSSEDPKAPEAWKGDGAYKGQSDKGGDVIEMLDFILSEAKKEEMQAHKDEENAQAKYEDSMADLKKKEAADEKQLSNLQEELAETEKKLLQAQEDLKATTKDKESIEAYLKKIKPGCDFITKNFNLREKNRSIEKNALEKAVRLIKGTPAYKSAVNAATLESYGDCEEPCSKDKNHVTCKACMADVTVPAFCAGHKGTKGC